MGVVKKKSLIPSRRAKRRSEGRRDGASGRYGSAEAAVADRVADQNLSGKCEIEDWTHGYTAVMQALTIDGVATCNAGTVRLRFYDGAGDARKFVGVETAYIKGHIFKAIVLQAAKPTALSIKYSIEPR